jgi:hypothetical protein
MYRFGETWRMEWTERVILRAHGLKQSDRRISLGGDIGEGCLVRRPCGFACVTSRGEAVTGQRVPLFSPSNRSIDRRIRS